jgi:hypothetical protein
MRMPADPWQSGSTITAADARQRFFIIFSIEEKHSVPHESGCLPNRHLAQYGDSAL